MTRHVTRYKYKDDFYEPKVSRYFGFELTYFLLKGGKVPFYDSEDNLLFLVDRKEGTFKRFGNCKITNEEFVEVLQSIGLVTRKSAENKKGDIKWN